MNSYGLVGRISICAALLSGFSLLAEGSTLCVNSQGRNGCYSTITAAVAAAAPESVIKVAPGVYKEDVTIGKSLSLIGAGRDSTIINADRLPNGIFIDGINNPGLSHVVVAGFTIENANYEGILAANASSVTILKNLVRGNDKSLDPSTDSCPGISDFETAEGFDCGEGVHLMGIHHSNITDNIVVKNAGGILLSDDTGAAHDNVISGNVVGENPFDCGITLASHPPATLTGSSTPLGVFHNTISGNESFRNGLGADGAGAGVGIFDSVPGAMNYGNVVVKNYLHDNGMPGVAIHSHTPNQKLDDNVIVANRIAGNGVDTGDAATPGRTGINLFGVSPLSGTVVLENVIEREDVDIFVKNPADIDIHLNQLLGKGAGINNSGPGRVDATENWWGCHTGPETEGCTSVSGDVLFDPFLKEPIQRFDSDKEHSRNSHDDEHSNRDH